MPVSNFKIAHNLSLEETHVRLKKLVESDAVGNPLLSAMKFGFVNDVFKFAGKIKGFDISGEVKVQPNWVEGFVEFPWLAKPFQSVATQKIEAYFVEKLQ
ncbi:MAG: polyhydroxyalkanoic acid system family protein [Zetaproteobacteria bacterium]|nr:polyhydroxyalkanoic acid system family protein [Zetaproteobacteria bacterium]